MPEKDDSYSNPLAPPGISHNDAEERQKLTNDDFRRLLMTPRAPPSAPPPSAPVNRQTTQKDDKAEERRKKKIYYAKLKKLEETKMAELAEKYRDRANERREGHNPDYQGEDPMSTSGGYRAVAPDTKSGMDAAERRRQMIQESKFLGGDMEHTHLVKGLDFALLQKVRSEIQLKEQEEENQMEDLVSKEKKEPRDEEEEMHFKTRLGRNIYRTVFKTQKKEYSEMFAPGRMAYVIDLEDEYADSDIPCTLMRSVQDCPSIESQTTLTTNDIVINKLTQILSYLRQGGRGSRKLKKKDKAAKVADDSIYGEIGEYVPSVNKTKDKEKDRERRGEDVRGRERKRGSYFERPTMEDEHDAGRDRDRDKEKDREREREHGRQKDRERDKDRGGKDRKDKVREEKPADRSRDRTVDARLAAGWAPADLKLEQDQERGINPQALTQEDKDRGLGSVFKSDYPNPASQVQQSKSERLLTKLTSEPEGYAECYPGFDEMHDAIDDSDDEVDYSKMDMGNKKGPVGRWDFDTQEEYSDYMNQKEAMPKAAFQYGVKMADGRRTRRIHKGEKNEKAELDREWQKISQIISKRKVGLGEGERRSKAPKYS